MTFSHLFSHSHSQRAAAARASSSSSSSSPPWRGRLPVSRQLTLPTSCCRPPSAAPSGGNPAGGNGSRLKERTWHPLDAAGENSVCRTIESPEHQLHADTTAAVMFPWMKLTLRLISGGRYSFQSPAGQRWYLERRYFWTDTLVFSFTSK